MLALRIGTNISQKRIFGFLEVVNTRATLWRLFLLIVTGSESIAGHKNVFSEFAGSNYGVGVARTVGFNSKRRASLFVRDASLPKRSSAPRLSRGARWWESPFAAT